jgi:RNA polymerase sigma factor (sigma-70 family)
MFDTIQQALILLRNNGDKPMHGINGAITPRPSDVLKAMNGVRGKAIFVHDDEDDEDDVLELLPTSVSAEDEFFRQPQERYTELLRAVRELTPQQQRVIDLLYWQGLDSQQASRVLSCTGQNVRLHHKRALSALREKIRWSPVSI